MIPLCCALLPLRQLDRTEAEEWLDSGDSDSDLSDMGVEDVALVKMRAKTPPWQKVGGHGSNCTGRHGCPPIRFRLPNYGQIQTFRAFQPALEYGTVPVCIVTVCALLADAARAF